ncbi:MAG: hypothetical protein KatS3mg008_0852 [Acidimicrobiales bacterium]|nr:MAG: hypothetical protein KatS3mg008_0852 [Acidimicrobiales bacterium]
MRIPELRELTDGPGDQLAAAFELVATPALFGLFGWVVDGWLGTRPVLAVLSALFVAAYCVWKVVHLYRVRTDRELEDMARGGHLLTGGGRGG